MLRNAFPPPSKIYCNGTLSDEKTQQKPFSAHYRDCSSARKASKAKRDAAPAASPFLSANRTAAAPASCRRLCPARKLSPPTASAVASVSARGLPLCPRRPRPRAAAAFAVDTAAYLCYFLDRWKIYNTRCKRCKSVSDNGRGQLSRFFVRRSGKRTAGESYIPPPRTK